MIGLYTSSFLVIAVANSFLGCWFNVLRSKLMDLGPTIHLPVCECREDNSTLITTPGCRLRSILACDDFLQDLQARKAMIKLSRPHVDIEHHHYAHALGHSHIHAGHGEKNARHGPMRIHMPPPEFIMSEVSAQIVLLANIWCW